MTSSAEVSARPASAVDSRALADAAEVADEPGPFQAAVRALVAWAVLTFALYRAFSTYAATIPTGGDPWMAGDWLINYAGGFVRRGLFGELFLSVAPGGQTGLWALLGIQAAGYALVVLYLGIVLHKSRYSWSSIALVCGPAGLAFVGWDVDGGFRKELLVFVALALLAWSRRQERHPAGVAALILLALPVWVLAVFSWESTVLVLPAVLYLLWVRPDASLVIVRRAAAAVFGAVAVLGAALSAVSHGDAAAASAVCEAVRNHGFLGVSLCGSEGTGGGGIEALGWTSQRAITDVAVSFPLYLGFLPLIALALAPVISSRWFRSNWGWAAAITIGVLPLFFVVTDYGRWIHILVMALTFCATADEPAATASRLWNPLSALLYVALWAMPHHIAPDGGWEWLGLTATLIHNVIGFLSTLLGYPMAPGFTEVLAP